MTPGLNPPGVVAVGASPFFTPTQRAPRLSRLACACVLLLAACFPGGAAAETASEAQLRAAYLVNFLKYVEWPAAITGANICVLGRDSLAGPLASYEGRLIQGREIRIRRVSQPEQLADCQEVFVPDGDEERFAGAIRNLGRQPVLTVGENARFVEQGGGVALVRVDNRLVFDVNLPVLQRAGLKVSPQMLRLARDVVGGHR